MRKAYVRGQATSGKQQLSGLWMKRALRFSLYLLIVSSSTPHPIPYIITICSWRRKQGFAAFCRALSFLPVRSARQTKMASWVISKCGLKPLPRTCPQPHRRTPLAPSTPCLKPLPLRNRQRLPSFRANWALNVSAPLRSPMAELEGDEGETEFFDPGTPPHFKLSDIRDAIPKHCWVKDPWRSMGYVVRDVAVVFGLAAAAAYLNSWAIWPLYWLAQGTMFWALFVLGHDCGHGSFSNNPKLNSFVGHLLHSSILVPYHGWRISHRTHHQNHGHVENDESWHPLVEKIYKSLDTVTRLLRFTLPFPMLAFPIYLWVRSPGKKGSHFDPNSDLFSPNERKDIITSTASWVAMVALLGYLSFAMGPVQLLKLYGVPYWTEAAKPVLGKYYREPKKSGPLPFLLFGILLKSMKDDHYVSDSGDVVYYQTDPQLFGSKSSN